MRFYPRHSNLDNAFAVNVKLPAPAFLVNVFRDLLLVYCSDCRVVFYSMEKDCSSSGTKCSYPEVGGILIYKRLGIQKMTPKVKGT